MAEFVILLFFQDANSVPEIFLKDLRDYVFETNASREAGTEGETGGGYIQAGYYRVRKLADGNCWMTENLDHPQQTGHYYYNWDTDLNSKTKWAPTANFIDGTVAGTPADLTIYIDDDKSNDHSFYGNGCPGATGSATPCNTRILQTENDGNQKNGTYYTFQAATSGTGGAISTTFANSPDTFCPLGWQLPYSGTGGDYYDKSKSWKYLFRIYNIATDDGGVTQSIKFRSYPFSNVFSGRFRWDTGLLYNQGDQSYNWSSIVPNPDDAYFMLTYSDGIRPTVTYRKKFGMAVRCVTRY